MILTRKTLGLEAAKTIAAAASAKAQAEGWTVVIAILDAGGHLIYLERADGTQLASVQVAQEKGRTAWQPGTATQQRRFNADSGVPGGRDRLVG